MEKFIVILGASDKNQEFSNFHVIDVEAANRDKRIILISALC
jgi:hypothetical protein